MRLALYQPDIPQNTAAILRLAACLGVGVDIIEPCGFVLDDRRLRRVGMDYVRHVAVVRHSSWARFRADWAAREKPAGHRRGRLILLSTAGDKRYTAVDYLPDDTLMVGRESAGVPEDVHAASDLVVRIPIAADTRSFNVAMAAAIVLGEALRQTRQFPEDVP